MLLIQEHFFLCVVISPEIFSMSLYFQRYKRNASIDIYVFYSHKTNCLATGHRDLIYATNLSNVINLKKIWLELKTIANDAFPSKVNVRFLA
jgi:hypothetical protein